jgi:type III secretion protein Q
MTSAGLEITPQGAGFGDPKQRQVAQAKLPVLDPFEVVRLNLLHRRRRPIKIQLGETGIQLQAGGDPRGLEGPRAAITLSAGSESVASVLLPVSLLDEIIGKAGGLNCAQTSPQSLLLLLEHLLSDHLSKLEAASGRAISLEAISDAAPPFPGSRLVLQCASETGNHQLEIVLGSPAANYFAARAVGQDTRPAAWPEMPIEVAFRRGVARVARRLLESVRPGDVIVADAMCAKDRVVAVAGERLAAAGLLENESLKLLAPMARLTGTEEETWSMSESTPPFLQDGHANDSALDDIAVKLMFEMGRKEISLGELRTITAGYIFDLSRASNSAVDIFAGSHRIGQGEIVQIGDALGVRVTRLFNNE